MIQHFNPLHPAKRLTAACMCAVVCLVDQSFARGPAPVAPPSVTNIQLDSSSLTPKNKGAVLPLSANGVYQLNAADPADGTPMYGKVVGNNLYLSFQTFQLKSGDTAVFQRDDGPQYSNVIARVTGGSPALIFGKIQQQSGNLILIDPAGVVVGPAGGVQETGSRPAKGSIIITTADSVILSDGSKFLSMDMDPILTAANPVMFGFAENTGAIIIQGTQLSLPVSPTGGTVTSLSLLGASVNLIPDPSPSPAQNVQLAAFGGRVNMAAVTDGIIDLTAQLTTGDLTTASDFKPTVTGLGDIYLSGAKVDTSTLGSGTVEHGGVIQVLGQTLELENFSRLQSISDDPANGPAGRISVDTTGATSITDGSNLNVSSLAHMPSKGQAMVMDVNTPGSISVTSGSILIDGTGTDSATQTGMLAQNNAGKAGGLVNICTGPLTLLNGGEIDVSSGGSGPPGTVIINASGAITAIGGTSGVETGIFARESATGDPNGGGMINILSAASVSLQNGAQIAVSGRSGNAPAAIQIQSTGDVDISGGASEMPVMPADLRVGILSSTAAIAASTVTGLFAPSTAGSGGKISVDSRSGNISLSKGGVIDAVSMADGVGGQVSLTGRNIVAIGGSSIDVDSNRGGKIMVTANTFQLQSSYINARAGMGYSAEVVIDTARQVELGGTSAIDARSGGDGFKNLTVSKAKVEISTEMSSGSTQEVGFLTFASSPPISFGFSRNSGGNSMPVAINSNEALVSATSRILTNDNVFVGDKELVQTPIVIPPVIASPQTQVKAVCQYESPDNVSTFTLQGEPVPGEEIGPAQSRWTTRR